MAEKKLAGIATIGCKLKWGTSANSVTKVLWSISNVPELEGAPENIDVTPITFSSRIYAPGVKGTEPFEFTGFRGIYGDPNAENKETEWTDEYSALESQSGKSLYWELEWPDGSKHSWVGVCNPRSGSAEVNGALTYVLNIMPSTEVVYTPPAAATANVMA